MKCDHPKRRMFLARLHHSKRYFCLYRSFHRPTENGYVWSCYDDVGEIVTEDAVQRLRPDLILPRPGRCIEVPDLPIQPLTA